MVALVALVPLGSAQLSEAERRGVERALFVGNMTLKDLEFERKPFADPGRLDLVNLSLDKPLDAADRLMALHREALSQRPSRILATARTLLGGTGSPGVYPEASSTMLNAVPANLGPVRPVVARLVAAIKAGNEEVKRATATLTPEERRLLIDSLPGLAVEEAGVTFSFVKNASKDRARVFGLVAKVDLARIAGAAASLASVVEACVTDLRRMTNQFSEIRATRFVVDGIPIVVGGKDAELHTDTNAMLTLDLGGDDRYVGRHGAGVGYCSVLIDLDGNDVYEVGDLNLGAGLVGVGIAYDGGGNDTYRTRSLAMGAGLAGVGLFVDESGQDDRVSDTLCQGFGQFGIGLLVDAGGSDRYDAELYAQGAARTQGVGWLVDTKGADVYRAGGLILNSPLFADVHYSFAQGFGSGYREDTGGVSGGIGLVTDGEGDDAYLGETYCQAASYWFSLGTLYDQAGHDTYSAYHYAQASAMHMTGAYLFDLAGDDAYSTKFGAAHAIGHDYGVAFLLDRAGSDLYSARDSRPGLGNANGLGIFIDAEGEDRYNGPAGFGNPSRSSGSLGVFVDLNGPDLYRGGVGDGQAALGGVWGVAYDAATTQPGPVGATEPVNRVQPHPGSLARPTDGELERVYALATQWGVGTAQKDVQANTDRLIGIGMPAFEWMLDRKLGTADRLQLRAFTAMVSALGEDARKALAPKIASPNVGEARNALSLVVTSKVSAAAPYLSAALRNPVHRRAAARAAGAVIGGEGKAQVPPATVSSVVQELMLLAGQPDRLTAQNAVISLSEIADPAAYSTGEALLLSPELPIRKAALELVAQSPALAKQTADRYTRVADERSVRVGLELLGRLGDADCLRAAAKYLKDVRPGVKVQAMQALNGRCPAEFRTDLLALRSDPDPMVKAVAAKIDPGRG
ncbi:MAG: hypothetical protein KIS66_11525 [Fimbriimonadaceae bacterium]|nr:hypothetical protein [Fimbriimonadaceae bacterium]